MHKDNKQIYYDGNLCLESNYIIDIPYRVDDTYLKVTSRYVNRLDLIAYDYYGSVALWYILAIASDLSNPLEVPIDSVIRIPTLSSLFLLRGLKL